LGTALGDAAKALVQRTQAPDAIAGQTILAAVNLVAQRHIDVLVPQGGDTPNVGSVQPVSCYFLTIATTGERKSSCEKIGLRVHREHEREAQQKHKEELAAFKNKFAAYEAKKKAAQSGSVKKTVQDIERELQQLGPEPERPADPTFIFDNPTWQGLVKKLRNNVREVGLFSDDAGKVLGGFSMSEEQRQATAANMNSAWDGKPVQRIIASEEPFILHGVRLSMHLMAQSQIAAKLLGDAILADQGFLARFLMSAPDLRDQPRAWTNAELWAQPCIDVFDAIIGDMLGAPLGRNGAGEAQRRTLRLSVAAFALHKTFYNEVQSQLVRYGVLLPIKGLAEKAPEHACRLAATMGFADAPDVMEISAEHYRRAIVLMRHYLAEALRLKFRREPDDLRMRADELRHWLQKLHADGVRQIDARTIQQGAPRAVGCRSSVDEVLKLAALLEQRGILRPIVRTYTVPSRGKGRTTWQIRLSRATS
jgi:hypothetical protein